jgi:hypothetical protein
VTGREIVDEVERLLLAEEPVPTELAADLLAAMPRAERERWLRVLVEATWEPEPEPHRP